MIGRFRGRERYKVLSTLLAVHFISSVDRKAMFVLLPLVAIEFSLSPVAIGLVSTAFSASYALAHVPGGVLADKFGLRRVASLSLLIWSIFIGLTGTVGSYVQLLLARFGFGLGHGLYPPCMFKTLANWFPSKERATCSSLIFAAGDLGHAITPAIVLTAAAHWGWRSSFLALCIPGIVLAIIFWKVIPDSPSKSRRISAGELAEIAEGDLEDKVGAPPAQDISAIGAIEALKQPKVFAWSSIMFAFSSVQWAFPLWLPIYLLQVRQLSLAEMGLALTLEAVFGIAGAVISGRLADRLFSEKRHLLIIASQFTTAFVILLLLYAPGLPAILVACSLAGFATSAYYPAFWSMPMAAMPKSRMGVTTGVINMCGQVGGMLGPLAVGAAIQMTGNSYEIGFWLQIAICLICCAITAIAFGNRSSRTSSGGGDVAH